MYTVLLAISRFCVCFRRDLMGICESVLCGGHPSDLRRVREVRGLSTRAINGVTSDIRGELGNTANTNGVLGNTAAMVTGFFF